MWQKLINEIISINGYNINRIASEIGIHQTTVYRLQSGKTKEPRYKTGARLVALYMKLQHERVYAINFLTGLKDRR